MSQLWHERYGHLNYQALKQLQQGEMVNGLPPINDRNTLYERCLLGKESKQSFPKGKATRAKEPLELVHVDVCGPMQTLSMGGNKYFLLFSDDNTRMCWIYLMKLKSEAFAHFKKFRACVEKESGYILKTLRTDRGGEFISNDFTQYCEVNGIRRELTAPYSPEQNGVAERKNRTLVEMVRSLLKSKKLPNSLWAEGIVIAAYLLNLSPTRALVNQTPFEAWHGYKPSVKHLRVFGCIAYALVPSHHRQKLDNKSNKCIFVGYCMQSKAYRLYHPGTKKIIISRSVAFNEEELWKEESSVTKNLSLSYLNEEENASNSESIEPSQSTADQSQVHASTPSSFQSPSSSELSPGMGQLQSEPANRADSLASRESQSSNSEEMLTRKYKSLADVYDTCTFALFTADPLSFAAASAHQEWRSAMEEEINSIERNETWDLVDLPPGKQSIGVKCVFKTKFHADGTKHKHKARLVAKGYSQIQGVDVDEMFSPVARFDTVRIILALVARMKWKIFQFDVKSAFLNGDLQKEVYV